MPLFHAPASRRQLMQWAALSASTLWLPRAARSQGALPGNPFGLGVASGSPRQDSVVLWTRLLQPDGTALGAQAGPQSVRWELAHDERFSRLVPSGQAQAMGALAHSVHVEVPGLAADRWYFYRFTALGVRSPVGRTKTLPALGAFRSLLRLGYGSCPNLEGGYFFAYGHTAARNPGFGSVFW